ncbi:hypothetical protein C2E25_16830 [Geothermobacter hydrogeniphilus]|uniref:Type I restriction modification DNA specificity domain-containing protein n=1 Tax=Geothermobacter hydrogeniphilus TaxID=1969733 RepID=A0A2K2H5J9_9BACT|nr:restriction endonuclease subunit S [Geothermobacter hydrogeniphilus]PNU18606.1 hypothetical protein C2E25_16830 [Geothermobacter hydrogeniphilus]
MMNVEKRPLGEVANVIRGVTFSRSEGETEEFAGALPVIRAGNVQDRLILDADLVWIPGEKVSSKQIIKKNDLVMCTSSGSAEIVGKCARAEDDWNGSFGAFCVGIRANENVCDSGYLFHFLRSPAFRSWSRKSGGANIKNIRKGELEEFKIPLPPLPEQRRIAAILDKADAIRRKRQQAIRLTEEFLRSVFLDMFGDPVLNPKGWETRKLGELIEDGPQNGLYKHASDYGSGTPIIRIDSFYDGVVTGMSGLKRVRLDKKSQEKYSVQKDDILINRVNSRKYLGKCAIVPELVEPTVFESNMMRFAVKKEVLHPIYLVSLLQHEYIRRQILNRAKDAVNQSSINQADVNSFEVRIPPMELQTKFAEVKDRIFDMVIGLEEATGRKNDLFNSLVQRAFRGEL